jgi:hypothetical protein
MCVCVCVCFLLSRNSSVGIATGWMAGVRFPGGSKFFSSQLPDRLWGLHSCLSNWYEGAFYPVVRRPGRETDHSPTSSAEVKNGGVYLHSPIYFNDIMLN